MVNWALQWRSERDLGPLENVEEVGPDGVCWFPSWKAGRIKQVASETAGLHPSMREELVRISGSCPGCSGGKRRRERLVYRRRRCAYITALFSDWRHPYQGQGVVLGAPLSLVSAGWLLGPSGKEEPPLPAPLLVEPFECGCAMGFLLGILGSSESPSLRAASNSHICSQLPSAYHQNSSAVAQPEPFSCELYSKTQQLTVPLHTFRYPQILPESNLDICTLTQALCPLRICHQHPFTHLPQEPEIQPHHNPIQLVTSSYRLHFLTVANLFFPLRSHHHWINSVPHHSFPGVVHHLQLPIVTLLPILFLPMRSPCAHRMSFQKCIYNPVTPLLKTLWWCLKQSQKANDKMGANICITYDKELTSLIYSECPYIGEKTNRNMGKGYKQVFHPLGMKWSTNLW